MPERPWPPDLYALTREEVDAIVADEDADVHDLMPAEWPPSAFVALPFEEVGCDVNAAVQRISETSGADVALAAVQRAAAELAAMLGDVVVYTCDYTGEDEQLAEQLDRVLSAGSPIRRLLP